MGTASNVYNYLKHLTVPWLAVTIALSEPAKSIRESFDKANCVVVPELTGL